MDFTFQCLLSGGNLVKKQTGVYRELHEFVLLEDSFISWLVPIFCGNVSRHWLVKL